MRLRQQVAGYCGDQCTGAERGKGPDQSGRSISATSVKLRRERRHSASNLPHLSSQGDPLIAGATRKTTVYGHSDRADPPVPAFCPGVREAAVRGRVHADGGAVVSRPHPTQALTTPNNKRAATAVLAFMPSSCCIVWRNSDGRIRIRGFAGPSLSARDWVAPRRPLCSA